MKRVLKDVNGFHIYFRINYEVTQVVFYILIKNLTYLDDLFNCRLT
jgi:hypothetical protein